MEYCSAQEGRISRLLTGLSSHGVVRLGCVGKGAPHLILVSLPTCASWLPWNFPLTSPEANLPFAGAIFLSFPMNKHLMGCTANRESFGSTQGDVCEPLRSPQTLAGSTQGLGRKGACLSSPHCRFRRAEDCDLFQGRPTATFLITKQKDYGKAVAPDCHISTELSAMTLVYII